MKLPLKTVIICLLAVSPLSISCPANARKVTTKVSAPAAAGKKEKKQKLFRSGNHAEMAGIAGKLNFMAYDKKTGASKETFFIDNGSDKSLKGIELEISYFNSKGKLIHRRTVEISQPIPAKETRKVDIASWDTQKSYHYINSVPSQKGSTPYTVRFKVLSCSVE